MLVTIVSRSELARRGHRRLAEELSERLPRFFREILFVEWSLEEEGKSQIVHCKLHAKSGFYRVTVAGETFVHAMHVALETLVEQRRRVKQRRVRSRRADKKLEVTAA